MNPGETESANGIDDDCDGVVDETEDDADVDGYTAADGDCNDADGWANPARPRLRRRRQQLRRRSRRRGLPRGRHRCQAGQLRVWHRIHRLGRLRRGARPRRPRPLAPEGLLMRTALLALVLVGCNQDISVDKVQPNLEVTPDPADVGDVLVGGTDQAELTLTRVSGGEVEIRSVTIENLSGAFFTWDETLPFVSNDAPGTLVITYAPTEIGWHEANVTITYNNEDEPSIEVGVRGHGVMGAARLYPSLLDFGAVPAGSAESKSITVVNEGDIALTLDGASFSDPRFTLNETTPLVIAPAVSMDVTFSFSADSDAAVEGTATLDFGGTVDLPDVFLRANDCAHGDPSIYDEDADGYTTCGGDCDDSEASAHPGGTEVCNAVDDDCDGTIDEDHLLLRRRRRRLHRRRRRLPRRGRRHQPQRARGHDQRRSTTTATASSTGAGWTPTATATATPRTATTRDSDLVPGRDRGGGRPRQRLRRDRRRGHRPSTTTTATATPKPPATATTPTRTVYPRRPRDAPTTRRRLRRHGRRRHQQRRRRRGRLHRDRRRLQRRQRGGQPGRGRDRRNGVDDDCDGTTS